MPARWWKLKMYNLSVKLNSSGVMFLFPYIYNFSFVFKHSLFSSCFLLTHMIALTGICTYPSVMFLNSAANNKEQADLKWKIILERKSQGCDNKLFIRTSLANSNYGIHALNETSNFPGLCIRESLPFLPNREWFTDYRNIIQMRPDRMHNLRLITTKKQKQTKKQHLLR